MSNDRDAAYRIGWVAGYGLGMATQSSDATPYHDMHTPWSNYVPAWIDEADSKHTGEQRKPFEALFRAGFNDGLTRAKDHGGAA
ncbi:hypothetical protein ACFS2C_23495 [Prauserella oleivorans]|uniref:Uncharacterized protein n=1 Tax=Prauserella oleivorans TaxID=1478153 RepID=A0ABW5WII4_9PSEU|nr:hypothetical protein [Prauserella muralis]TWE27542.1 hypothetical protein FHX69_0178 [Prauserella muralis]